MQASNLQNASLSDILAMASNQGLIPGGGLSGLLGSTQFQGLAGDLQGGADPFGSLTASTAGEDFKTRDFLGLARTLGPHDFAGLSASLGQQGAATAQQGQ